MSDRKTPFRKPSSSSATARQVRAQGKTQAQQGKMQAQMKKQQARMRAQMDSMQAQQEETQREAAEAQASAKGAQEAAAGSGTGAFIGSMIGSTIGRNFFAGPNNPYHPGVVGYGIPGVTPMGMDGGMGYIPGIGGMPNAGMNGEMMSPYNAINQVTGMPMRTGLVRLVHDAINKINSRGPSEYEEKLGEQIDMMVRRANDPNYNMNLSLSKGRQEARDLSIGSALAMNLFGDGDRERQMKVMNMAQDVYAQHMVLSCIQPLSRGVNLTSLQYTIGMGAVLWMTSKKFRTVTKEIGKEIFKDALQRFEAYQNDKDVKMYQNKIDTIESKLVSASPEQREHLLSQKREFEWLRDNVGNKWEVGTSDSVGTLVAGSSLSAAMAMRSTGEIDRVMDDWNQMSDQLYAKADNDKIVRSAVDKASQTALWQYFDRYPAGMCYFEDTVYGGFLPDPNVPGRFANADGQVAQSGTLRPRKPMSVSDHYSSLLSVMGKDLLMTARTGDIDRLNAAYKGYLVGISDCREQDYSQGTGIACDRAQVSQAIRYAMEIDGLTYDEINETFITSLNATNNLIYSYEDTREIYGQWQEKFQAQLFEDFENDRMGVEDLSNMEQGSGAQYSRFDPNSEVSTANVIRKVRNARQNQLENSEAAQKVAQSGKVSTTPMYDNVEEMEEMYEDHINDYHDDLDTYDLELSGDQEGMEF